jgi:hypothetical protein
MLTVQRRKPHEGRRRKPRVLLANFPFNLDIGQGWTLKLGAI